MLAFIIWRTSPSACHPTLIVLRSPPHSLPCAHLLMLTSSPWSISLSCSPPYPLAPSSRFAPCSCLACPRCLHLHPGSPPRPPPCPLALLLTCLLAPTNLLTQLPLLNPLLPCSPLHPLPHCDCSSPNPHFPPRLFAPPLLALPLSPSLSLTLLLALSLLLTHTLSLSFTPPLACSHLPVHSLARPLAPLTVALLSPLAHRLTPALPLVPSISHSCLLPSLL